MKRIILALILTLVLFNANAQRYLSRVFNSVTTTSDINYGAAINYQNINQTLKLDFYQPTGDILIKRPLVIYMHGGGFTDVAQTKTLPHIVAFCDSLALMGYIVASIDYRLDTTICHRAVINAMHDERAAVRFFKANAALYKIDTAKIFIGGESAGAISSLNVNYIDQASEVAYPPDGPFSSVVSVEGNSGNPGFTSKTQATLCFCGGTKSSALDLVFDTAAIQNPTDPALLMIHGTSDPIIPVQYALEVGIKATNVGVPNLFYTFNGATHCPWFITLPNSWEYLDTLINYTTTFLYNSVGPATEINESVEMEEPFKLFPNPSSGKFSLICKMKSAEIKVYNIIGKRIYQSSIQELDFSTIDLSEQPGGIYFFSFSTSGKEYHQKLVKK